MAEKTRKAVQAGWAALTNAHFAGFLNGKIYTGKLKSVCVPGLNCYSCPGALGSCPIGALQAVLGGNRFSFYLAGFFLAAGTLFGRFICGFLCPFGLIQELLHKIPFSKKIAGFRFDTPLRYLKYAVLAVFVIALPLAEAGSAGVGQPWFCKLICPAGTLEGALPLLALNPELRGAVGFLFTWKIFILIVVIALSVIIFRPFCKYLCPLGAVYALFNKFSIYKYEVDETVCISCMKCETSCPMQARPRERVNHPECVRCGVCKNVCPTGAISSGFRFGGGKIREIKSPPNF